MSATPTLSDQPLLPAYGSGALADLLPSVGACLGAGGEDRLGLGDGQRWVVLLVDGLGSELLAGSARQAPFLAGHATRSPLTVGVPSTTVTSLSSLGTGLSPGQHGMAGYTCRVPESGEVLNCLLWDRDVRPRDFQPTPTAFEQLDAAGVAVSAVMPQRFHRSGLTEASLRGTRFNGVEDEADLERRTTLVVDAAVAGPRTLVYAYERELDHVGHSLGCRSFEWLDVLRRIDTWAARLRAELPDDVRLVVTGDHGMVDVPRERQIIVEDHPDLLAGVGTFAGEGRLRQLWCEGEPIDAVRERWHDLLGDRAWVRTRDEAVEEGWFGPMDERVEGRFGEVLVAMRRDWAVMTLALPRELSLVGMHGSLTPAEMRVPLVLA